LWPTLAADAVGLDVVAFAILRQLAAVPTVEAVAILRRLVGRAAAVGRVVYQSHDGASGA
jgi:hypothetical protein